MSARKPQEDQPVILLRRPSDTFRYYLTTRTAKVAVAFLVVAATTGGAVWQWPTIHDGVSGMVRTIAGDVVGTPTADPNTAKDNEAARESASNQVTRSKKAVKAATGVVKPAVLKPVQSLIDTCQDAHDDAAAKTSDLLNCVNQLVDATETLKTATDKAVADKKKAADDAAAAKAKAAAEADAAAAAAAAAAQAAADEAARKAAEEAANNAANNSGGGTPTNSGGGGGTPTNSGGGTPTNSGGGTPTNSGGGGGTKTVTKDSTVTAQDSTSCTGTKVSVGFLVTGSNLTVTITGPAGATGVGTYSGSGTISQRVTGGAGNYSVTATGNNVTIQKSLPGNCLL